MKHTKVLLAIMLSLVISGAFAQSDLKPTFYLNSELVDMENVHINVANVDDIQINKEDTRNAIYIIKKRPITFLTLDDVLKRNNTGIIDQGQVVYRIKDKLVTDKSKVKIDPSFYIVVDVKRFDTLNYIDEVYRKMVLVDITLLDKQVIPEEPK